VRGLTARAALHSLVLPVSAGERPPFDVAWLRSRDVIFAVHEEAPPASDGRFLGVVGWASLGRFPKRIFADQLPHPSPEPVALDCPLEEILERFDRESRVALPVLDEGRFQGAVTRNSAAEALLSSGVERDPGNGSWERMLSRLHLLESYTLRVDAVVHDLATALQAVANQAELLARRGVSEELLGLRAAARQSISLLERLRGASSGQHRPESIPAREALETLARQAQLLLPPNVELRVEVDAPDAVLHVDRADLERVVSNLVANAREAMPTGGLLLLRLDRVAVVEHSRDVFGRPVEARTWTRLEVADTGHGMDEEALRSVFQPLFSTRAESGRGLGLSIVQRLVHRNQAFLRCSSEPGRGTRFEILF